MKFESKGFKIINDVEDIRATLTKERAQSGVDMDFYLLDYKTLFSKLNENIYKPIKDISLFNKDSNFVAPINIRQTYTIEVFPRSLAPKREFGFKVLPECEMILRVALLAVPKLKWRMGLKNELYQELYKTLILHGYLIGIREYGKLSVQFDRFIALTKDGANPEKTGLNVGVGVNAQSGKDGSLEIFYDLLPQNELTNEPPAPNGTFMPRVHPSSLRSSDLLMEYQKPLNGHSGRDLRGVLIPVSSTKSNAIKIDPKSIKIREDAHTIKYDAAKDGFFKEIRPGFYAIVDDLRMDAAQAQSGVQNLKPKDENRANAVSAANAKSDNKQTLRIDGQTHSKSKIEAQTAFIGSHKGFVKAHSVVIDVLEKGRVEAKVAYINSAVGGIVCADYIYIRDVRGYNEIYPRVRLVVDNISGEHNTFDLNPTKFSFQRRDRVEYVMLSDQIKIKIRLMRKSLDEISSYLLAAQSKVYKIKNPHPERDSILALPANLPKNLQSVVDQYESTLKTYKGLLAEYRDIANIFYTNEVRLKNINEAALDALMLVRGELGKGETIVKFRVYNGTREELLKVSFTEKSKMRRFSVKKDVEGIYRLKTAEEFSEEDVSWIEKLRPKQ